MTSKTQPTTNPTISLRVASSGALQRKCACGSKTLAGEKCSKCGLEGLNDRPLHRKSTFAGRIDGKTPVVYDALRSSGQPVDSDSIAFLEPRFGHDFSQVRVNSVAKSEMLEKDVNVREYTVGQEVGVGAIESAPRNTSSERGGVLQRKCACGGTPGPSGECAECEKKKKKLQRKAIDPSRAGIGISPSRIPILQPKLTIGASNDPLEQEANRVADEVLAAPTHPAVSAAPPRIQRISGQPTSQTQTAPAIVDAVLAIPGMPLEPVLRHDMEHRFGHDFSQVRIHSGAAAEKSAHDVMANAFTVGHNIVFGAGQFAPTTQQGRRLLSHELTHVVQQRRSTRLVQRQEEENVPRPTGPGSAKPGPPLPDVIVDPTALSEPNCPRTPTGIGNLAPTPECNEEGEDFVGTVFQFCTDSDVFSNTADLDRLRAHVSGQPSGTSFSIRTFASVEGPGSADNATHYNRNLSCHRLNRMIRELLNLGVQEQQIDTASLGPTERFGTGVAGRPLNRIAMIQANPPQQSPRPDAKGLTMAQIRNLAKQRIASGDYPLAADAYLVRWSCGRWRTLAEAVTRTTVQIQEEGPGVQPLDLLGIMSATGANTITISSDISDAADPIGCAANRIADLTFHHFSRPVLSNFEDQHRGGMHLVHLAGFPACQPNNPINTRFKVVHAQPIPADPFTGFIPRCADQPLSGPLASQKGPATMETPPTFTVTSLTLSGTSGGVGPSGSNPITVGVEPDSPFVVEANIDAVGAPASIANFEIGFVQTVMAETWINTHVDGRREIRRFPLPLRDGPPRNDALSEPPWFDKNSKVIASPGANQIALSDAPNFRAFQFLPDIPTTQFVQSISTPRPGGGKPIRLEREAFDPGLGPLLPAKATKDEVEAEKGRRVGLANNAPDRGRRVLDFNTWVVARRRNPPAPATQGSTQFLSGLRLLFSLTANWLRKASGGISGTGSFSVSSRPATSSDGQEVMLRGATPVDFVGPAGIPLFAEFLNIEGALPRARAGGLARDAYINAVQQIAQPHRTTPFLRGDITVRIGIEVATGRVILDTPDLKRGAIRVLDANRDQVDTPEVLAFARAIFPEVRKLVIGTITPEPQTAILTLGVPLPRLGPPSQAP